MDKEEQKFYTVDFEGFEAHLPILPLPSGIRIAFSICTGTARSPSTAQNC